MRTTLSGGDEKTATAGGSTVVKQGAKIESRDASRSSPLGEWLSCLVKAIDAMQVPGAAITRGNGWRSQRLRARRADAVNEMGVDVGELEGLGGASPREEGVVITAICHGMASRENALEALMDRELKGRRLRPKVAELAAPQMGQP